MENVSSVYSQALRSPPRLVVGNKNYSSWSLRIWFLMRALDLPFSEMVVSIYQHDSKPHILVHSPSGRVPALIDGDITVWDSLAIIGYLSEIYPDLPIWPRDFRARTYARSICAEMHAEFRTLRAFCPMNIRNRYEAKERGVAADVERAVSIMREARERYGHGGPYLLGEFSVADAVYLPVLTRFRTYSIAVDKSLHQYMDMMLSHPVFLEWEAAACDELWVVAYAEVPDKPITAIPGRQP